MFGPTGATARDPQLVRDGQYWRKIRPDGCVWPFFCPLEAITESDGRLGAMRDPVGTVQLSEIVGGRVIDQAPIFGPDEHVRADVEIRSAAVDEGRTGFCGRAGEIFRIEHQAAGSGQQERREMFQRDAENIGRRRFGRMSINAESAVTLRVGREGVVDLDAVVFVEENNDSWRARLRYW